MSITNTMTLIYLHCGLSRLMISDVYIKSYTMKFFVAVYFIFYLFQVCIAEDEVVVKTAKGLIKGFSQQTRNGVTYSSFLGIRYAQSPTDYLRFQTPQPINPWDGVFDATKEKGMCFQVDQDNDLETEDCLLLNLFTPVDLRNNSSAKLPVMFFIHGGGFIEGTGILEWGVGPIFFMEYDVIMIAINYRLGPFGFLSTGDNVIPGNLGMKDQIFALKWVQENIEYFGGDPTKVTIFGQSAGSASVSYLLLSPLATGLFRAAILESGSALSPWGYQRNHVEIAYKTAAILNEAFNETNTNSTELLSFLKTVPARDLDAASFQITQRLEYPGNMQISKGCFYTPSIEPVHDDAFLTSYQYESFEQGLFNKVPVLIGLNAEESMFMLSDTFPTTLSGYDSNNSYLVPFDMHIQNETILNIVGHSIKEFYSPNSDFDNLSGVQYHSNQDFDKSIIKQGELQAPYTPVYFYEFTYSGKMGNNINHLEGSGKVTHGEEQNYIFSRWYSNEVPDNTDLSNFPQTDINVHSRFMTLFTNFAKHLNPTPKEDPILENVIWPTVRSDNFVYLDIGENLVVKNGYPKSDMYIFWNELYKNYGSRPFDSF
ncbi:esterase FE4-like isoform X1 [Rhynchophorus ferrugineus]|uniref:esterase FE4-like isoform X1 n=1 Tax=Rhynchophorus ferrugineus TaxID=354439 RepID=UPI003FCD9A98